MFKPVLIAGGGFAVLVVLGFIAWGRFGTDESDHPSAQRSAQGQTIYREQCASCHGANLEGQLNWRERQPNGRLPAPPHDASGHTWHHPDDVLFGITKHGLVPHAPSGYESDMPVFDGKLTDDQIRAVLAYIKSQWPLEIQERQKAITEQAKQAGR